MNMDNFYETDAVYEKVSKGMKLAREVAKEFKNDYKIDLRICTFTFDCQLGKGWIELRFDNDENIKINSNIKSDLTLQEAYERNRETFKKDGWYDDIQIVSCMVSVFFEKIGAKNITVNILGD